MQYYELQADMEFVVTVTSRIFFPGVVIFFRKQQKYVYISWVIYALSASFKLEGMCVEVLKYTVKSENTSASHFINSISNHLCTFLKN